MSASAHCKRGGNGGPCNTCCFRNPFTERRKDYLKALVSVCRSSASCAWAFVDLLKLPLRSK